MRKPILMDSKIIKGLTTGNGLSKSPSSIGKLNGSGKRAVESWVDTFTQHTANLDSPELFRKWAGITTIAAALEQKVRLPSGGGFLFPNMYIFLIGHPGTGKTRTIRAARSYLRELPEPYIAPNSMTFASLVDELVKAKRFINRLPDPPIEYNSIVIAADELGTFIHKYDKEMVDGLSAFYDPDPYGQTRRGKDINIKIKSPQINLICGSTPSNLLELMPEGAWGQGFTSRVIMVFSDERIVGDDFASIETGLNAELAHDLKIISSLSGDFAITADYRNLVKIWRDAGETIDGAEPPKHPRLAHYNTRRRVHLYKLSMIAAIDRSNTLVLTRDDFNRAMRWLAEAEIHMPDVFKAGVSSGDAAAQDELYHFIMVNDAGSGVPEAKVFRRAVDLLPSYSVERVIKNMVLGELIAPTPKDRFGRVFFKVVQKTD